MSLENLAGICSGEFGLAGEKVEVHTFLQEIGTIRKLVQAGFDHFLRLLDFPLFNQLVGLMGEALFGACAG
jgi:hypothetical protein